MKKIILTVLCASMTLLASANEEELLSRLRNLETIVPARTDEYIVKRIKSFIRSRKDTEQMIGRSSIFFPIFERYITEYDLPSDLMYITCLETELNNKVISSAGAKGVWQLMTDVREEFGLRVDATVDERYDIFRGTEAALKDLKRMYKVYQDWELTLAGYNCGAGCVGRAMKRAKSREFNRVKRFLPEETQNYIPKFIAFTYIMKNYEAHGMKPSLPELDKQCLGSTKVVNYLSLQTVAAVTGLPYDFVSSLNPQFRQGSVPASQNGYNVILPRRVLPALNDYLSMPDVSESSGLLNFRPIVIDENLPSVGSDPNYYKTEYTLGDGESLETLGEQLGIEPYNIMMWNNLPSRYLAAGSSIVLYLPRIIPKRV